MNNNITNSAAEELFGIKPFADDSMTDPLRDMSEIYYGRPDWLDDDDNIKTINFAKSVCEETARLATMDIGVQIDGSPRAEWLQDQYDRAVKWNLRHWVEYGAAFGTVIFKPTVDGVNMITPALFRVTHVKDGRIVGIVIKDQRYDPERKKYYTRLEYNRPVSEDEYAISNRCYIGESRNDLTTRIAIEKTPWVGLAEDAVFSNVDRPLFGVLRMPSANNIDVDSPMGMPIFSGAVEEMRDLDIAYSRNAKELFDSKRTVLMDSDRLIPGTGKAAQTAMGRQARLDTMRLPDYVRIIEGEGNSDIYHEINPTLQTGERINGINSLLSQIGYKCGFSNGYFVFNEKTGMVTATQVESDDRRTLQLIKDVRDRLQLAIDDLLYAMSKYADAYDLSPVGEYETAYDFADITYNVQEDKATWFGYVLQGRAPFWRYLMKFEGMSEDEAKELASEATQEQIEKTLALTQAQGAMLPEE